MPPSGNFLKPGTFWLNAATLEPRKNHARLLQAYSQALRADPTTMPLVIAGAGGWKSDYLPAMIMELGIEGRVMILGYVGDPVLQWLYENCYAFLYPSLFEGFGLPPLEAMSLGAAVITSNVTALPEVVGNAAVLVDPLEVSEIAAAILSLSRNPERRTALQSLSRRQALGFTWEKSARQVLDVYEALPRMNKRSES